MAKAAPQEKSTRAQSNQSRALPSRPKRKPKEADEDAKVADAVEDSAADEEQDQWEEDPEYVHKENKDKYKTPKLQDSEFPPYDPGLKGGTEDGVDGDEPPPHEELVEEVIAAIQAVIQGKRNQIRRAIDQKGGWEGWLQVELADYLEEEEKNHLFNYSITRERMVFDGGAKVSSQRIDIWFRPPKPAGARQTWPAVGVELKCASISQNTKKSYLATRFQDDIKKCAGGAYFPEQASIKDVRCGAETVLLICVGITHDEKDLTRLGNPFEEKDFVVPDPVKIDDKANKDGRPLWMMYASTFQKSKWLVEGDAAGGDDMDVDDAEQPEQTKKKPKKAAAKKAKKPAAMDVDS